MQLDKKALPRRKGYSREKVMYKKFAFCVVRIRKNNSIYCDFLNVCLSRFKVL